MLEACFGISAMLLVFGLLTVLLEPDSLIRIIKALQGRD